MPSSLSDPIMAAVIEGAPVGKGRPRFARRGGFVKTYTPKPTREWERKAADVFKAAGVATIEGPVAVTVRAYKARPQRLRKHAPDGAIWRTTKPDVDNVAKIVLDALILAAVIRDDTQVCILHAYSLYAAVGDEPRVAVHIHVPEGEHG